MRCFWGLLLLLGLTACVTPTSIIRVEQPQATSIAITQQAMAGAASVDLTPQPGMPMGGYSIMANKGQGFRTRIKARIVYLNDGKGNSMALVQGDLTAGSLLVHHLVAAKVAQATGLQPEDIAFTASHTHSSPVNFFDNDFYNKHTSSGRWLAEQYLYFVVEQISAGIVAAHANQRPAKIATGKREVYGLTRNRAMSSYVRNEQAQNIDLDDPEAKFQAINPDLTMIRVDALDDDGRYKPLAAFSGFSMHNTTMDVPVQVYNGDVYAYPQRDLEWQIQQRYQPSWTVVHALAQATHADMAPATPDNGDNWIGHSPANWVAARKLGQQLSQEALALFDDLESQLSSEIHLASSARELNIRENNQINGIENCQDAAVGAPVAAGAYERRTPWLTLIPMLHGGNFFARRHIFTGGCQGAKLHLGGAYLQPLLEPKDSFPNTVMFQILKVNDMLILPLPFEVTAEAGKRIAAAVQHEFERADVAVQHAWVASVANGYFGYTTTPEEYSKQNYEGGHTLYGKNSTPYLAAQLQRLAQDHLTSGKVAQWLPNWEYQVKTNEFVETQHPALGQRKWLTEPTLITTQKPHQENYVRVRWLDVNASKIDLHQPLVRVEQKINEHWQPLVVEHQPIDDQGYDIEVRRLKNTQQGMAHYEARWYNPINNGHYRFNIAPRHNQPEITSSEF